MDANNRGGNYTRPAEGLRSDNRPTGAYRGNETPNRGNEFANRSAEAPNRAYQQPGNFARPVERGYGYNRPQEGMAARPQEYARPNGSYGSSFYGNPAYGRPATDYARQQALREPTPQFRQAPQYNSFNQRAYAQANRAYSQPYSAPHTYSEPRSYAQPQHFGGNSFYGGRSGGSSHESYRQPKAPKFKAPKEHGGHSGGDHHSEGHRR